MTLKEFYKTFPRSAELAKELEAEYQKVLMGSILPDPYFLPHDQYRTPK